MVLPSAPKTIDLPAIAFRWFPLTPVELRHRFAIFSSPGARLAACLGFAIQRLRGRSRTAHLTESQNLDLKLAAVVFHPQQVADFHFAGRFGGLRIGFNAAKFAGFGCKDARLKKPRRPEPLVYPQSLDLKQL